MVNKQQVEKAAAIGCTVEEDEEHYFLRLDNDIIAMANTFHRAMEQAKRVIAFKGEYKWFKTGVTEEGEFYIRVPGQEWEVTGTDFDELIEEALQEFPEPPEGQEEEEEVGSIVPQRYKNEYKARGDETRCGDWLCETIDPWVTLPIMGKDGKSKSRKRTDLDALRILCKANGVDRDWPQLNNGQRAMNMRNMLRSMVVQRGTIIIPAQLSGDITREKKADPDWLTAKRRA